MASTPPPIAPAPPPAPVAPPPLPPRRTGWKVLIVLLAVANVLVFGAYFGLRYFSGRLAAEVGTNDAVVPELSAPPTAGGPTNFLVIGSDSRDALPDDFGNFGNFSGQRADVIMVVQLMDGGARILSLPRDLKVELEGRGAQKINAAYAFGGAPLMVKTVRETTGLEIHHYAEIDFFGFASMVDELGGVTIRFPNPARDPKSGLDVDAGEIRLDGQGALAYARSRQYQELRNGTWQSVDGGDLGRIQRQQRLIFAMLSAAKRPSIVFDVPGILSALGDHMSTDSTLDGGALVDLALEARSLDPGSIDAMTLPTRFQTIGGVSYLVAEEPAASDVIAGFAAGGEPEAGVPAEPLRVEVLNGNGGRGQATEWSETLVEQGFEVASVGDASSFDFTTTVVRVEAGDRGRAEMIVTALGFGRVEAASLPDGVDAVVVLGADALSP